MDKILIRVRNITKGRSFVTSANVLNEDSESNYLLVDIITEDKKKTSNLKLNLDLDTEKVKEVLPFEFVVFENFPYEEEIKTRFAFNKPGNVEEYKQTRVKRKELNKIKKEIEKELLKRVN